MEKRRQESAGVERAKRLEKWHGDEHRASVSKCSEYESRAYFELLRVSPTCPCREPPRRVAEVIRIARAVTVREVRLLVSNHQAKNDISKYRERYSERGAAACHAHAERADHRENVKRVSAETVRPDRNEVAALATPNIEGAPCAPGDSQSYQAVPNPFDCLFGNTVLSYQRRDADQGRR